jgi:hypothetical protein
MASYLQSFPSTRTSRKQPLGLVRKKILILPAINSVQVWDAPFARETINQKKIAISGTNVKDAVIIVIMKRNVLLTLVQVVMWSTMHPF